MNRRHFISLVDEHAPRISVDGAELAVSDTGAGTGIPLVCLHAAGHGSRDFEHLWLPGVRRVAVDWPDHGRSGADRVPPSPARYAELLEGLLDALALDRAVLLGNSIGGAAALQVAVRQPARVRGLVLCDSGGLVPHGWMVRAVCSTMARIYRAGTAGAWWFDRFFAAQYRVLLRGRHAAAQRARIVAAGREMAPTLRDIWRSFSRPEADLCALTPQVRCPVLLAWARQDPFNPYRLASPALRQIPRAQAVLFPGGHAPFLEQPERFLASLAPFLAALP